MTEQLDLLSWVVARNDVIDRCRAKYADGPGGGCVTIYADDMQTIVRVEACKAWCPLLKEAIE